MEERGRGPRARTGRGSKIHVFGHARALGAQTSSDFLAEFQRFSQNFEGLLPRRRGWMRLEILAPTLTPSIRKGVAANVVALIPAVISPEFEPDDDGRGASHGRNPS